MPKAPALFVSSNLATSLDGKIATAGRELFHLGTPADRAHMQVLRKRADIVLIGAGTLRTYRNYCGVRGAPAPKQIANAVLSRRLEGISHELPFFANPAFKRILFVTGPVPRAHRQALAARAEIVPLNDPDQPIAMQVMTALEARGFQRLLLEGGGDVLWNFASYNLIDEYHVTLTPKIIGGRDAPTLVEGAGFTPEEVLSLKLARCRRLGDELYLTYRRSQA